MANAGYDASVLEDLPDELHDVVRHSQLVRRPAARDDDSQKRLSLQASRVVGRFGKRAELPPVHFGSRWSDDQGFEPGFLQPVIGIPELYIMKVIFDEYSYIFGQFNYLPFGVDCEKIRSPGLIIICVTCFPKDIFQKMNLKRTGGISMNSRYRQAVSNILGRRSIRRFDERPVEKEKVSLILECAFAAPSAGNARPTHVVIVDDRPVLNALAEVLPYGKMLSKAPLAFIVCADTSGSDIARLYWEEDCAAAMQNILLAAYALELGGVWLGVHHAPESVHAVRNLIKIPDNIEVLGITAIGYPAEKKDPHEGIPEGKIHVNQW